MMICSTIISQTSNSSSSGSWWARTKTKTCLERNGQNVFKAVEKSWINQSVWSNQKNKKCHILTIFPCPEEIDPYMPTSTSCTNCQALLSAKFPPHNLCRSAQVADKMRKKYEKLGRVDFCSRNGRLPSPPLGWKGGFPSLLRGAAAGQNKGDTLESFQFRKP